MANNHVIFIHPDGTSPAHYAAARFASQGPDGRLNWDNLSNAGVYLGHMKNQLTGTSNAGAVTHANGVKVYAESFGLDEQGTPVRSLSSLNNSAIAPGTTIMEEAVGARKVTALINSGFIAEPGTGAFAAQVGSPNTSAPSFPRQNLAVITEQILESGINFIMGGGELHMLPVGTTGRHVTAEIDARFSTGDAAIINRPQTNLIEKAKSLGYTVVYTRDELKALLDPTKTPVPPQKVLGVFAAIHTFNDQAEEALAVSNTPNYVPTAPTVGEMADVAQRLMEKHPNFGNGSLMVLEEEGTDNFGNVNNARGTIEATLRADAAIGVALGFIERHPNTLLITAADSDAGGLQTVDRPAGQPVGTLNANPNADGAFRNTLDGVTGRNTQPFVAAPDASGDRFPFGVGWVGTPDFAGSLVSKAHGLNADKLGATVDNTDIYRLMYKTLFDVELPALVAAPTPAPKATKSTGNVIFIHPDGTSPAYFAAARFTDKGPDGRLNWDMMSNAGVYLGHMENQLTGTSNAGAITHANGVKVDRNSYGLNPDGSLVTSLSGETGKTIMDEAREAGKSTAIINSGFIAEPGSGAFIAKASNRNNFANITEQIIRSGTNVILGGGELHMLPVGTTGRYVTAEVDAENRDPLERPQINLIDLAKSLGYSVVYTLDELKALPTRSQKVLGVFASENTYNDRTEAELAAAGLSYYGQPNNPNPPTVAQMLQETLRFVSRDPDGFFVVLEEEGTDNFGNDNNAGGAIAAVRRADAAIGVAMDYIRNTDPNTLLITAADSEAGGLQVYQPTPFAPAYKPVEDAVPTVNVNPALPAAAARNPLDGVNGSTAPWTSFAAKDSLAGPVGNFGVGWVGTPDFPGSIVSKTYGMNADLLPSTLDNTEIYRLMYQTLFGRRLSELENAQGGQRTIEITLNEGFRTVLNFGGIGRGVNPSGEVIAEADTLKFTGAGLTARNLLLTQVGDDLVISFEGIANTGAVLKNFQLENIDNLRRSTSAAVDLGNIIFDGFTVAGDDFDVFNADDVRTSIFNRNTVTFLNDLDNRVTGFDNSNDVINGLGGNDILNGLGGDDLLRGGRGADIFVIGQGKDTIADFNLEESDRIALPSGLSFNQLSILQGTGSAANNTLIQLASSNELLATLRGIQASTLGRSAFTVLA